MEATMSILKGNKCMKNKVFQMILTTLLLIPSMKSVAEQLITRPGLLRDI